MTAQTVDPAVAASSYRATLLGRLGDRDPEVVQADGPAEMRRLVAEAGQHLRARPAPNEWSVLELVGHIVDAELVVGSRYRFILAEEQPAIVPYDQDLWVERLQHNDADPEELIASFAAMRAANLALWQRTSAAGRARVGLHAERGPETCELTFRLLAGHDLVHLEQAWQTLATVRTAAEAQRSAAPMESR
jgi:hypothetical protein